MTGGSKLVWVLTHSQHSGDTFLEGVYAEYEDAKQSAYGMADNMEGEITEYTVADDRTITIEVGLNDCVQVYSTPLL